MKILQVTINLMVDDEVELSDITVYEDDVIDGFNLSRTDRLGDITNDFYIKDAEIEDIKQIL